MSFDGSALTGDKAVILFDRHAGVIQKAADLPQSHDEPTPGSLP